MSQTTGAKCVLVIDDDEDFQKLFAMYLRLRGYKVFHALNGVDAIGILDSEVVHIVVTEWLLPMLDGSRFLQWLRQEAKKSIPVLVLTANEKSSEEYILHAGADAVLYKPVKGSDILDVLEKLMSAQ